MLNIFRQVIWRLKKLPLWIKIPVILMEFLALGILSFWLYFTRSVETVTVPDLIDREISYSKRALNKLGLNYRILRRTSTQTSEDNVLRQVPPPGSRIMETRQVELYVSSGPELVEVPDLTNKTLFESKNYLYRQDGGGESTVGPILNLGSISRVYRNKTEEGEILLQNPKPESSVLRGSQVDVLVSKGEWPRRTVIPDLVGKSVKNAKKIIERNKLEVGEIRHILKEDKPPSVILRQSPPSGRITRRDRPISLTVNLSRESEVASRRYTFLRVTPPLSVFPGQLKIELLDRQGSRVVFNEKVNPGKKVEFMISIKGNAKLTQYWNGEIYRFQRLEYER